MEREYEVDLVWWPFELHPETPREGVAAEDLVARRGQAYEAHRERLKAIAAEVGLPLASNRVVANSHRALELAEIARERDAFRPVHDALFTAYFAEGRDIGDESVLLDIAREAGLDPVDVEQELASGEYAQRVDEATAVAREKGFGATPTIIFGDGAYIPGAQDWQVYETVLARLGARRRVSG